ncbi:hypothetical protein [Bartonella sp. DGB2]|uniref:hypothetical protein n=1 Tax=Bartonella sp. DGB2 TaxID=3388426 RepID=UPI0039901EC2
MTAEIAQFIRKIPRDSLKTYFEKKPHRLADFVDWNDDKTDHVKPLLKAVDELTDTELAKLKIDAERVHEMTDDIGQQALLSAVSDQDMPHYSSLESAHDRALFVFLQSPDAFSRAEDIRYADDYRKGRMWDGFLGPKDLPVLCDEQHISAFENVLADYFRMGGQIKVEIFNRTRLDLEDCDLVQIMIYREGLPASYLAFENRELTTKQRRPVNEMVLTYEARSGTIEVIAERRECREELVKLFSRTLLQQPMEESQRVPLRKYDITKLLQPYDFPTDPEDGIEAVKVMMLELRPYDNGNKVRLTLTAKESKTIHEISDEWFDAYDPLRMGFLASKAKLSIRFKPDSCDRRGKTLPVEITWPNGCDLKGKTSKEQLIGDKYLKRWGLLKEIE